MCTTLDTKLQKKELYLHCNHKKELNYVGN